jgi:transposase
MTRFLTDSERVRLRTNHKYERDGRVRDRIKAVLWLDKGWTPQQIAEALMIDEDTVNRHIREYQTDEKLKPENGGSTEKLNDDQKAELIQHLDDVLYVTVKDICTYVFEKYGIELHFLPPYSPNLNPIERLWKVMNEHARNNVFFKTVGEFKGAIHNFFENTWPQIAMSMVDRINDNFSPVKSASSV